MDIDRIISVLLADAQPLYREGIKSVLTEVKGIKIVGEVDNNQELLVKLRTFQPDVLILDYNPRYFDSDGLLTSLKNAGKCKVMILSSEDKKWNIIQSLNFNVYAYLTKNATPEEVITAIRKMAKGEKVFCQIVLDLLMQEQLSTSSGTKSASQFSERELEISKLIAYGKKTKQIAEQLFLSPHTVHTHRKNIMRKLGVSSAIELSVKMKEIGVIN